MKLGILAKTREVHNLQKQQNAKVDTYKKKENETLLAKELLNHISKHLVDNDAMLIEIAEKDIGTFTSMIYDPAFEVYNIVQQEEGTLFKIENKQVCN